MPTAESAAAPAELDAVLESAGLRYTRDSEAGFRRTGEPGAFEYVDANGRKVTDARDLARFAKLAIPPAWTDVWISADARGHLQATGRDARGRKQYRYHAHWREERDCNKFERLAAFGAALPALRAAVLRDLALPGLQRRKVLAAMIRLLDTTFVRVGDERYRRDNNTYGLTTLRNRHVQVIGDRIRLRFRGKAGKEHDVLLSDKRLARVVRRCRDLPGYELFQYVDDDGEVRSIGASDVNEYLKEVCGADYTAKDFRTWGATVIAASTLMDAERAASDRDAVRAVNDALRRAADVLGNTVAVCRKSYVHPGVLDAYRAGNGKRMRLRRPVRGLRGPEPHVLRLLQRMSREAAQAAKRRPTIAATLEASLAGTRSRRAKRNGGARAHAPLGATKDAYASRKTVEARG
jgi:DNA topoisomerase-1